MFFSAGVPRSSTSSAILPAASSRTRPEMQMPPGSARDSSREAMMTPSPRKSSPSLTTSPWWTPMRRRSPSSRSRTACCMAMAERTACTALAKAARKPSPVVLKMRPPCDLRDRFDNLEAQRAHAAQRARLVSAQQPRVADNVGRHDGGKAALLGHSGNPARRNALSHISLSCGRRKETSSRMLLSVSCGAA